MKQDMRDFFKPENIRKTWEYKSITFILRGMVALGVIIYLLVTVPATWVWMKTEWVRRDPPGRFAELVAAGAQTGDFKKTHEWLMLRPRSEVPLHANTIAENAAVLPSIFFDWKVQAARAENNAEDLRFWTAYQRYRLRYDVLRCGDMTLVQKLDALQLAMQAVSGQPDPLADVQDDPARMGRLLQDVLDYDAQHPAANDPRTTCDALKKMSKAKPQPAPREYWADIRHTLRRATEAAIRDMKKEAE